MMEENVKSRVLLIMSLVGFLVAGLSGLAEHIPWLEAACTSFSGGCRDAARITLLRLPVWAWGMVFYAALALAVVRFKNLTVWMVSCGAGVEIALVWSLVVMKAVCIFCIGNLVVILLVIFFAFRKDMFWQGLALCLLLFLAAFFLIPRENQLRASVAGGDAASPDIAARAAGEVITNERLEGPISGRIVELQKEIYRLKRERLDQVLMETLIQKEATARNLSIEQLLNEAVPAAKVEVSQEEMDAYYRENQARLKDWKGSQEDLRGRIKNYLVQQKRYREIMNYAKSLETKYDVSVYLKEPQIYRAKVNVEGSPSIGPATAPVLVVEFSDYQCPACRQAHETVLKVRDMFKDKVRWVFKDYPLKKHKYAEGAAEAAHCAAEQNRFWDLQNVLYSLPEEDLGPDRLVQHAVELGLNKDQFSQCLNSGKYKASVEKDIEEGKAVGVDSTPAFFINGRISVGGPPLEQFKALIEEELAMTPKENRPAAK